MPDSFLDIAYKLKAMCHHPDCTDHDGCPKTHNPCGKRLDMQTAIAWMLSDKLQGYVSGKIPYDEIERLANFCFQTLGQHQEATWFREDIFGLIDWLDVKLRYLNTK